MSKMTVFYRYSQIIKRLMQKPYSTLGQLQAYLGKQQELLYDKDENAVMALSERTLKRDIRTIKTLFGLDIEFSRKHRGYFVANSSVQDVGLTRMIEAFDVFNSLDVAQDLDQYLYPEKRKSSYTDNMYGMIHAIKNRLLVKFDYEKFWEDERKRRHVQPYALKEFRNRWYLLAKDLRDGLVKTFGLDRIHELQITSTRFPREEHFDVKASFYNCFGIIVPDEGPQDVVLSFDAIQGKYVKSLPLHHSQKPLIDTNEEYRIQLHICITHDFIMELLSYGHDVKVLAPEQLIITIYDAHKRAAEQYAAMAAGTG